jgi:hypothetical protein
MSNSTNEDLEKEKIKSKIKKYIDILSELTKNNDEKTIKIEELKKEIDTITQLDEKTRSECEKIKVVLETKEKTLEERNNFLQTQIQKIIDIKFKKTYTMKELDDFLESEEQTETALEFSELEEPTETDIDIQYKTYKSKLNEIKKILNNLTNKNLMEELLLKIDRYIDKDSLEIIIKDKVSIIKYINEIIPEVSKKSILPAMDNEEKQKYKDVLTFLNNLIIFINDIKLTPIEPLTKQISKRPQPRLQRNAQLKKEETSTSKVVFI